MGDTEFVVSLEEREDGCLNWNVIRYLWVWSFLDGEKLTVDVEVDIDSVNYTRMTLVIIGAVKSMKTSSTNIEEV